MEHNILISAQMPISPAAWPIWWEHRSEGRQYKSPLALPDKTSCFTSSVGMEQSAGCDEATKRLLQRGYKGVGKSFLCRLLGLHNSWHRVPTLNKACHSLLLLFHVSLLLQNRFSFAIFSVHFCVSPLTVDILSPTLSVKNTLTFIRHLLFLIPEMLMFL